LPQFVIERTSPGASTLTQEELAEIAAKSNEVVEGLTVPYTWVTSYVAGDKIYCIHETEDAETVREHGRCGGFPVDSVMAIANEFGPGSA
jgi:hypothetical protein